MSQEWKGLTDQDKVKYDQMHQELKAKYQLDLQAYKDKKGDIKIEKPTKKRAKKTTSKAKSEKIQPKQKVAKKEVV